MGLPLVLKVKPIMVPLVTNGTIGKITDGTIRRTSIVLIFLGQVRVRYCHFLIMSHGFAVRCGSLFFGAGSTGFYPSCDKMREVMSDHKP